MSQPIRWTREQLLADVEEARSAFRDDRTGETIERYTYFFEIFANVFAEVVDELNDFAATDGPESLTKLARNSNRQTAIRYLSAPPISADDLRVLADTKISAKALRSDDEGAVRVRHILLQILDRHRFPWVGDQRPPSQNEREIAIVSSAALVAAKKIETERRSRETKLQENAVKRQLKRNGLVELNSRPIHLLEDAPPLGHYCPESVLGGTRADMVLRLFDRRVMAIECKATNSEVNSFKRVNHEALGKAAKWITKFGTDQIVPAAVLSGVFKVENLVDAQSAGLNIFWSHRLQDLARFIEATREGHA